jgi:hypothetical protein
MVTPHLGTEELLWRLWAGALLAAVVLFILGDE